MPTARVTVTLPAALVEEIDGLVRNRSAFILEAVRQEIRRRRREALRRSLRQPHPESAALAGVGFAEWAAGLPAEDVTGLGDPDAGQPVRWVPGEGWVEERR